MPLAGRPRHTRARHAATRAIHPPHRGPEEGRHVPGRPELEPSGCKPDIPRSLLAAARTDRLAIGPRLDVDLQKGLPHCNFNVSLFLVAERLERLDAFKKS